MHILADGLRPEVRGRACPGRGKTQPIADPRFPGIEALARAGQLAATHGAELRLALGDSPVARILQLTGLDAVMRSTGTWRTRWPHRRERLGRQPDPQPAADT